MSRARGGVGPGKPDNEWLDRVYRAATDDELAAGYDGWAADYDADLVSWGYKLPAAVAGLFGRHVDAGEGAVLDAGCGTGMIGETLHLLGYRGLVGIDLSEGMLAVARAKAVYQDLYRMKLGETLDFPDGRFAAATAVGVLTVGHAKPDAFDELIRVTRPGAPVIFSIRVDGGAGADFLARQAALERDGRWRRIEATPAFRSMPGSGHDVEHRVFVYRVA